MHALPRGVHLRRHCDANADAQSFSAVANLEDMDWDRVRRQLAEIGHEEPWLGPVMAKLHPRVIRDAKRLALG
jgi:hypothetical protein